MKKGKFLTALLSTILLATTWGTIVSANNDEINTIKGKEIYKIVRVYDDNEQNVVKDILTANGQIKNLETGETIDLTVESIKTVKINDLARIQTNGTETATQYKAEAVLTSTTGTQSGSGSDASYGVTVYETLYYTTYSKNNFNYVAIDKIDYRFGDPDPTITVSNKQIKISQNGVGYANGGKAITNQQTTRNASDSETILVRNWGWDAVLKNGLGYATGTNITATLQRGTTSNWTLTFNFQLT
ncbi:hypothetical protein D3C76_242510 [compost metagenome]